MRLIDAEALKLALQKTMDACVDEDGILLYSDHLIIDADYDEVCNVIDEQPTIQPEQRTDTLKAEIKRMKRSFTTCINSDYYTGYMSALSAVEGYIAKVEGANNDT